MFATFPFFLKYAEHYSIKFEGVATIRGSTGGDEFREAAMLVTRFLRLYTNYQMTELGTGSGSDNIQKEASAARVAPFSMLQSGARSWVSGNLVSKGLTARYWVSTATDAGTSVNMLLYRLTQFILQDSIPRGNGGPVRCVAR